MREHAIDLLIAEGALAGVIEMIDRADHLFIQNVAVAPERQGGVTGASYWRTRKRGRREWA